MLRAWDLNLQLIRNSSLPLHLQIAQKVIDEIQQGRLLPAAVMPGTRELAEILKVNRKTVVLTYEELVSQGWLASEDRRGTFVSKVLPSFAGTANRGLEIAKPAQANSKQFSHLNSQLKLAHVGNEDMPDARLIPLQALSRSFRSALLSTSRTHYLDHAEPKGRYELRAFISDMLNMERGLHIGPDNICMVRGSQMAAFIAARIISAAQGIVVFESLTYPTVRETFKSCGAQIMSVAIDQFGIKVSELEKLCKMQPVRAVFVTPQHQYPTTVTLSAERRKELLRLAEAYDFLIIEDGHDHEFDFSDTPTLPLASDDRHGRVIYIGSLSHMLSPGLNVAYLAGPVDFIDRCAEEARLIDQQGNMTVELVIFELMQSGEIKRHMRRMTKVYGERRTLLKQVVQGELDDLIEFEIPDGGLAFWLRFKHQQDMQALVEQTRNKGFKFSTGSFYAEDRSEVQAIRLGFASLNAREMGEGVERLKSVMINTRSK